MKYLQIAATVACATLLVIAWQLHGMRPLRYSEIERMLENHPETAFEKMRNAPIVTLGPAHTSIQVDANIPHQTGTLDVNVVNEIDARVRTGGETLNGLFYERPLKVEVE